MKIMRLELKYSVNDLIKIITELLQAEKFERDAYVRITVYKSAQKIGVGLQNLPSDICIFAVPFDDYYEGKNGLDTCISSWRRVEDNAIPARAKIVGAYANSSLCKADAVLSGFDEAIVLSESGSVSEGSATNLFLVKHGELITPDGTQNILEGITRATIMTLAEDNLNLKTNCREVDRSELYIADELFFTGTGAQVKPILSVDKRVIGNGKAGPLTTKLMDLYYSMAQGKIEKYKKWLISVY